MHGIAGPALTRMSAPSPPHCAASRHRAVVTPARPAESPPSSTIAIGWTSSGPTTGCSRTRSPPAARRRGRWSAPSTRRGPPRSTRAAGHPVRPGYAAGRSTGGSAPTTAGTSRRAEAGVRQQLIGDAPVVETLVRIPGGDAVQRVYGIRGEAFAGRRRVGGGRGREPLAGAVRRGARHPPVHARRRRRGRARSPSSPSPGGAGRDAAHVVRVDGRAALLLPRRPARVAGSATPAEGDVVDVVQPDAADADDRRLASGDRAATAWPPRRSCFPVAAHGDAPGGRPDRAPSIGRRPCLPGGASPRRRTWSPAGRPTTRGARASSLPEPQLADGRRRAAARAVRCCWRRDGRAAPCRRRRPSRRRASRATTEVDSLRALDRARTVTARRAAPDLPAWPTGSPPPAADRRRRRCRVVEAVATPLARCTATDALLD